MRRLTFPVIHRNGTHPETLLGDVMVARERLREAMDALAVTAPNGRDYYCHALGDRAMGAAVGEHEDRARRLASVYQELEDMAAAIIDGVEDARIKVNKDLS